MSASCSPFLGTLSPELFLGGVWVFGKVPGLRLEKQELLLRVQARVQRAFLMFLLEAIKVTTKLGRVSEASFCPATTESHQGQRGRKGKIPDLGISILGPISRLLRGFR